MSWRRTPTKAVGLAVASFLALLFVLRFYFAGFGHSPGGRIVPKRQSWRRDTGEYILNPSWDVNAPPQKRYYNWTLSETSGNPDGVLRTLLVINSQFPGPLVEANEADTLVIDVHNQLTNSTSLHWHGFTQNGTNFMDGTVGVTNCPIPPGSSFRYEFKVDDIRGTYWYHAHFSTQRVDGLFGPLVIHSPKETIGLEYESDRVVMVQDWYHDLSAALLPQYLAPGNENAEPVPNGALINGRNLIDCSRVASDYNCDVSSSGLEILNLERDKSHRLRFINVGAFSEFDIELDEHQFSLVEVDGVEVEPYKINRLRINVAQRYSIIIPTARRNRDTFWLRARMLVHCFASIPKTLEAEVKAIIHYTPSSTPSNRLPTTNPWSSSPDLECKDMNLTEVSPLHAIDAPPTADLLIPLRSNFEIGAYKLSRGFFNNTSWRPSATPTLLEAISHNAYDTSHQLVVSLRGIQTIDLLINNFDDGNHPFHLHGHRFWVLGQGTGYFDGGGVNTTNPLRRDTATIQAFGWILLRFVADNPGMWAMHCHLAWHLEAGMLMQFLVRPEVATEWTVPPEVAEMCSKGEMQRGGPIDDKDFYW